MTSTINDAFLILRALSESNNPMLPTSVEPLKKETGLSDMSFEKAEYYLLQGKYIEYSYDGQDCWLTEKGIEFLSNYTSKRIAISFLAEKIARFLFSKHPHYTASLEQIQVAFECQEVDCEQAMLELIDEGLAENPLRSTNTLRISMIRLTPVGRGAIRNNFMRQQGEIAVMENNQIKIDLGDGNVFYNSNVVAAEKINNSFNKATSAEISDELKDLLKELAVEVGKMSESLGPEEAEQVARDLETLTAEAISKQPRQRWWQLSVEGLQKAAENVGKVGIPVISIATKIAAILSAL